MGRPIIEVRNLSKQYRLGAIGATSLREEFHRYWDRLRGKPSPDEKEFWALRDVSFDVQPGEAIGVIGRNGAGKSTLLKILSRITEPTSGRAVMRGRVASLLEVGTGFHPELTGRENIFLNGAILGMTKAEVRRKFDEIVAFAEVEKFIDTPVKHYSSGMYVRLAFAVAAHLEPEILIVDEVLSVGDIQFQKKSLGKMRHVAADEGRTVLFVSHNMAAVRQLCSSALLLKNGRLHLAASAAEAIESYVESSDQTGSSEGFQFRNKHPDLQLLKADVEKASIVYNDSLTVRTLWQVRRPMQFAIECVIRDHLMAPLAFHGTGVIAGYEFVFPAGIAEVVIHYPRLPLAQGHYSMDIIAARSGREFFVYAEGAVSFQVDLAIPMQAGYWFSQGNGSVYLPCEVSAEAPRTRVGLGRPTP